MRLVLGQAICQYSEVVGKRVVIKIGSAPLASGDAVMPQLCAQVAEVFKRGDSPVLVSSGAVARGMRVLRIDARPDSPRLLQACAAIGQVDLMAAYAAEFKRHGLHVAQILLTHDDICDRERYRNARATLDTLADKGVVAIVNENDSVATEEISVGDNDELAAMCSAMLGADVLVFLSRVKGVMRDGGLVRELDEQSAADIAYVGKSAVGTGGMRSKVDAALRASRGGVRAVIASVDETNVITRILDDESVGTSIRSSHVNVGSRKAWIAFGMRTSGTLSSTPAPKRRS